jgi:membrane-bound serine protease (ClpP class)
MSADRFGDLDDVDIEERLRLFARSSRTPPLPDEIQALPWTVQLEQRPRRILGFLPTFTPSMQSFRGSALAATRLAATLVVAMAFVALVTQVRSRTGSADYLLTPPSPAASVPGVPAAAGAAPEVVLVPTSGVVDDVMADHVAGAIRKAESDKAGAVIIQLDTLGGSGAAMQRIVESLYADVPTIVWVGPPGAKAASAGTFITLAANLAYMAPSTNIGAASPVAANGSDIASVYGQTEADKVMQDAIATITGIAQHRHPLAVAWAVSTVQDARSYSAQDALAAHAVNGLASSLNDVLSQVEGQTVTTTAGETVIHVKGAVVVTVNEDAVQAILHTLDDPNIAFILLVIGVLCVLVEFFHPTLVVGLTGALSLALSFYGSGSLPLNILGVVLVILGLVMLVLETGVPSHGLLTVAGLVIFLVGAVAFYGSPGPYLPDVSVAWPIILTMTALAALYGLVLVRTLMSMRRLAVPAGSGMVGTVSPIGKGGEVQADLAPLGTVYVSGESWTARAADGSTLLRGTAVRVVRQEGLTLVVEPAVAAGR